MTVPENIRELKCYMCQKPLSESEKDDRIFELENRLHRIDSSVQTYIDGFITPAELAGIIRTQRDDIPGENHYPSEMRGDFKYE